MFLLKKGFLYLFHFRISESDECRMTISSLAIVFGPTIVGYSEAEPDHMLMLKETKDQARVCHKAQLHAQPNCYPSKINIWFAPTLRKITIAFLIYWLPVNGNNTR